MNEVRKYRRSGITEIIRRFCRSVDFLVLLVALRMRSKLAPLANLKCLSFVELGPGPMRIASLKRILFREVFFVDQSDFGIPDPQLRLVDIEACHGVQEISTLCGLSGTDKDLFLFADHCIEHLTPDVVLGLLSSMGQQKLAACFRVPNLESPAGRGNFARDPTHRSPFDQTFRRSLNSLGFAVYPWVRWYRVGILMRVFFGQVPLMNAAEEIVVCGDFC